MEKVKLPRHVAEALEEAKGRAKGSGPEWVAWCIPNEEMKGIGEYWGVLYDFGNEPGGFFKLIDALRYGYDIQPEPITVTVTAEMQEAIRRYFEEAKSRKEFDNDRISWAAIGEVMAIKDTLDIIGLKIPGVNV